MPEILPPASSTTEYYRAMPVFVPRRAKDRWWLHLLLLALTMFTTLVVGARMEFNYLNHQPAFSIGDDSPFPLHWALSQPSRLLLGIPFSAALMFILLAHEMGHYLCARYYGVQATLPFFIPFPTLFGTMGAFIRIRSQIRSRAALFDIGIAGPIAGFVCASAVLIFALPHSQPLAGTPSDFQIQLGYPLIFRLAWRAIGPAGMALGSVALHPTAIAAWVGMFATALNLLPGGQLDGGHIVFALAPRAHRTVSTLTIIALLPLAYYCWLGWLVWAVLLRISGMRHPMVPEWPGITGFRRWLALLALIMLILTLTPAPLANSSLPEVWRVFRS
ncbi:MAG TPA: site-2 protease family protein [Terriglobales bacterium]